MISFFKNMNLARAIIVGSLLLSAVLGYVCYGWSSDLRELEGHLKESAGNQPNSDVAKTARGIMELAQEHSHLSASLKGEGLSEAKDLVTYIRKCGAKDAVELGDLDITPNSTDSTKGITDARYVVKSSEKGKSYQRLKIVNFAYTIEDESRRVRITELKLENADKNASKKMHEIPEDKWNFECTVTSRQRTE